MSEEPVSRVYKPLGRMLRDNFLGGIFWALGTTLGFALIIVVVGFAFRSLGGVPLIGNWIAGIVESTNEVLEQKGSLQIK